MTFAETTSSITSNYELVCSNCQKLYHKNQVQTFCTECGSAPIVLKYALQETSPEQVIDQTERSMWRYSKVLPLTHQENRISLGKGGRQSYPYLI